MKKINRSFYWPFLGVLCAMLACSCANTRPAVYFADEPDSTTVRDLNPPKTYIQPNDILSISISSLNPQATLIFNSANIQSVSATGSAGGTLQTPGYLVSPAGYIQFAVLGDIKVSGLTTDQIRKDITQSLLDKKLLIDPIVMVRQLNFKISVLGEVGHPTVINVPSERISLLEALGLAGDITIYGRKDNVMIIREEDGIKKIKHLDLNSDELFTSPYYYLKSNDIVLVSANKNKIASTSRSNSILPIVFSALSLIAVVVEGFAYRH